MKSCGNLSFFDGVCLRWNLWANPSGQENSILRYIWLWAMAMKSCMGPQESYLSLKTRWGHFLQGPCGKHGSNPFVAFQKQIANRGSEEVLGLIIYAANYLTVASRAATKTWDHSAAPQSAERSCCDLAPAEKGRDLLEVTGVRSPPSLER